MGGEGEAPPFPPLTPPPPPPPGRRGGVGGGGGWPGQRRVYAIEGTRFQAGSDVSPAVAAAGQAVAEAVLREPERADAAPKA